MPKYVDPSVSRIKFEREVAQFKVIQNEYIKRGIWLLKDEYPIVVVAFAKALSPPMVIFGAVIDFTDYDLRPLSVTLVNLFTQIPLKASDVLTKFIRLIPPAGPGLPPSFFPLLQSHSDDKPFICLPGIREYHEHPAHTGDAWLLHRGRGEGTLHFVVDKLHLYGVQGILGCAVSAFNFQIQAIE